MFCILCIGLSGVTRGLSGQVSRQSVCVSVRVCVEYDSSGTDFSGLVRKRSPALAGPDSPRSCADDPAVRRSVDLPSIFAEGYGCSGYVFIGIP
jgi:hypothetical protein